MFQKNDKEPIKANLNLPQAAQPGGVDGRQVLLAQGEDDPGPQLGDAARLLPSLADKQHCL